MKKKLVIRISVRITPRNALHPMTLRKKNEPPTLLDNPLAYIPQTSETIKPSASTQIFKPTPKPKSPVAPPYLPAYVHELSKYNLNHKSLTHLYIMAPRDYFYHTSKDSLTPTPEHTSCPEPNSPYTTLL